MSHESLFMNRFINIIPKNWIITIIRKHAICSTIQLDEEISIKICITLNYLI